MDLVLLGMKLKEDSITYRKEYLEELRTLETLISVHSPPLKQIRPILSFIVTNCHVDPERSVAALLATLDAVKDVRVRKSVLGGLILVRQKGFITSRELIMKILAYGGDLTFYLKGCQEFLDVECYGVLTEWYGKGTERQKAFCYYLLLVIFSNGKGRYEVDGELETEDGLLDSISDDESVKRMCIESTVINQKEDLLVPLRNELTAAQRDELENIICEAFFGAGKVQKICMLYFLNRTEVAFDIGLIKNGAEHAKRMLRELNDTHFDRDTRIMKLRIFVLFKKHFQLTCSITGIVLKMIDLEKDDLGALLDCLVGSVERREVKGVFRVLCDEFVSVGKDDDMVCYGLNVMREIYYRLAGIEKPVALNVHDVEGAESEETTEEESGSSSEASGSLESNEDPFVIKLRELVLQSIEPFRGNRTKSIHYAYKALIKAVVKGEAIDKPTTFILKPRKREEREKLRKENKEERKREVQKEKRERKMKKNRKGRVRNKKNRLNEPPRPKRTKKY